MRLGLYRGKGSLWHGPERANHVWSEYDFVEDRTHDGRRVPQAPLKRWQLVDEFLASEMEVVENGVSQRRTAFEITICNLQQGDAGTPLIECFETVQRFRSKSGSATGGMRIEWVEHDEYLEYLRGAK